jgi:hypothetical protein
VDFGAVGRGEQAADLVGRAVDLGGALGGCAMEEVDEAPGELLGVVLERGVGEQGEEVGPDGGERLLHGFGSGRFRGSIAGDPLDLEMAELELGELGGKAGVHLVSPRVSDAGGPAPGARGPGRPPLRTASEAAGNPRPRLARAAARSAATRAESRRVAARRRRVRALSRAGPAALLDRIRYCTPPYWDGADALSRSSGKCCRS